MLKLKNLLDSEDDIDKIVQGIYMYYTELGLPANLPPSVVRGTVVAFGGFLMFQIVSDYNNGVASLFYRTRPTDTSGWSAWRKVS